MAHFICVLAFCLFTVSGFSINPTRDQLVKNITSQIGQKEKGNNRGPFVDMINTALGLPLGSAWCNAFVKYNFELLDIANDLNGLARSCCNQELKNWEEAQPGDTFGLNWKKGNNIQHSGFVLDYQKGDSKMLTVEGNTSLYKFSQGVAKKQRDKKMVLAMGDYLSPYAITSTNNPPSTAPQSPKSTNKVNTIPEVNRNASNFEFFVLISVLIGLVILVNITPVSELIDLQNEKERSHEKGMDKSAETSKPKKRNHNNPFLRNRYNF